VASCRALKDADADADDEPLELSQKAQTACEGGTYVDAILAVSKTSKREYIPTYSHLRKCEYTVRSSISVTYLRV